MANTLDALTTPLHLSLVTATAGSASKRLIAAADGTPRRDPAHTLGVSAGRVETLELAGLSGLAALLARVTPRQCLVHGVPAGLPPGELAQLTTTARLAAERARHPGATILARSKEHFAYPDGVKLLMLDIDPAPGTSRYARPEDIWQRLVDLWPACAEVGYLAASSTSSAIKVKATGEWLREPDGWHLYFLATGNVDRWREVAKVGLWLAGTGYCKLATPNAQTGVAAVLERCLVDLSVWSPERLDFVAGALIDKAAPFVQARPAPELHPGGLLDLDALPEPTADERGRYAALVADAHAAVAPERRETVRQHLTAQTSVLAPDAVEAEVDARLTRATRCELTADHLLYFAHRKTPVLARDVSAKLDGQRCADPLEPEYNAGDDAVFHWRGGDWCLVSWAHGEQVTYRLEPLRTQARDGTPDEEPDEPPDNETDAARAETYEYVAYPHGLKRLGEPHPTTGRQKVYPLTNFDCEIVAETTRDDGSGAVRKLFGMRATVGKRMLTCEVPAGEFAQMLWVGQHLGAHAVVRAGQGTRDHARAAIQLLSQHIDERYVFEHTGWREMPDGRGAYLHGDGALTAHGARSDVLVELPGALSRYRLPPPPTGDEFRTATERSLALRSVLDDGAMVPLLGAAYLAPLRPFLLPQDPPDFVVWSYGPTGSYKSETAALCLNHYGSEFSGKTLPGSFVATANALERLCFATKDALLVVDDFHPATNRRENDAMAATVSRLLRGVGNGTGRARMSNDTTARPDLPPRGVVLATGERLPDGHSNNARMFLVTLAPPSAGTAARLTEAQRHREAYALAMSGFIAWLARHQDAVRQRLAPRFRVLRAAAQASGAHARQPGAIAHLMLAWEVWTECARDAGALTEQERAALLTEVWDTLCAAASGQAASLQALRPEQMALSLWSDGFAGKRAYLETLDGYTPDDGADWGWTTETARDSFGTPRDVLRRPPGGAMLGYVDADWLYLLPEAAYQYLSTAARAAGQVFPVELKTLLKHLDEAGVLAVQGAPGDRRRTVVQRIGGKVLRVVKLARAFVTGNTGNSHITGNSVSRVKIMSYSGVTDVTGKCAPLGTYREKERKRREEEKKGEMERREEKEEAYAYCQFTGNIGNNGNSTQNPRINTGENSVTGKSILEEGPVTAVTPPQLSQPCPRCGADAAPAPRHGHPACVGCSLLDDAQLAAPRTPQPGDPITPEEFEF